jgi:hypothetical protein
LIAVLLCFCSANLLAQDSTQKIAAAESPAPATTVSAGVFNDWLRNQDHLFDRVDLGGQFRARYVYQTYFAVPGAGASAVDFRANTPKSDNDFLLLRTRFHGGYSPTDWLTVYAEGQNSSSTGDRRNPNAQSDGPADLRQAYFKLGGFEGLPLSLQLGRQELIYGDERLVGTVDWDNIGRTFDAARLRFENKTFWVDVFTSSVLINNDNQFNEPNYDDWFSGIYASTRALVPKTELQLYFFSDNASGRSLTYAGTSSKGNSPRDIYTIGSRFQTLPDQLNGWDLNGEFVGQFGNYQYPAGTPGVVNGTRLNQLAYATHIEGGYTFQETNLRPRVGLGFDYASGDDNPNDRTHNTFVNLYPSNHKFYGAMDFFSWQNLSDPYAKASITPLKNLSVALTYNALWLASTSDFFYQVNQSARTTGGYGIHSQNDSFVGHELDLVVAYKPKPFLQLQAGFGHFFIGSYVRETLQSVGGSTDANWVYVQAQVNL